MRLYTSILPIDADSILALTNARISSAFMQSVPPRNGDMHGGVVDLYFSNGNSLRIDGIIVNISPKTEVFTLCIDRPGKIDNWEAEMQDGHLLPVIETHDLVALWISQGLEHFVSGPRAIKLYKRVFKGKIVVTSPDTFDAIHIYAIGPELQGIVLYASWDFPGNVVLAKNLPTSDFAEWVELSLAVQ